MWGGVSGRVVCLWGGVSEGVGCVPVCLCAVRVCMRVCVCVCVCVYSGLVSVISCWGIIASNPHVRVC